MMVSYRFLGWLIVEVKANTGDVGIGEAALAPRVTKQVINLHLKPILPGKNPLDTEFLWQHMYRRTIALDARESAWWRLARRTSRCGI